MERNGTTSCSSLSESERHAADHHRKTKAALCGGLSIKVDADYTSKACPVCGHTADENRPRKGLLFVCQNPKCGYTLHADLIGARNVTMRTLLVRQHARNRVVDIVGTLYPILVRKECAQRLT
jgi:transposase